MRRSRPTRPGSPSRHRGVPHQARGSGHRNKDHLDPGDATPVQQRPDGRRCVCFGNRPTNGRSAGRPHLPSGLGNKVLGSIEPGLEGAVTDEARGAGTLGIKEHTIGETTAQPCRKFHTARAAAKAGPVKATNASTGARTTVTPTSTTAPRALPAAHPHARSPPQSRSRLNGEVGAQPPSTGQPRSGGGHSISPAANSANDAAIRRGTRSSST